MKATVRKTNQTVEVYKHKERGTYINFNDCTTEYKKEELININK